jgi:hypothetical protein
VAYSHVEREWFPTDEAYEAEGKSISRRCDPGLEKLGILRLSR